LWLLLAVVVDVVVVVVAVLATAEALLSALRDVLDREEVAVDVVVGVASANVAMAGVEGLLARPLLVFPVLAAAGWTAREAASFLDDRVSSSCCFLGLSFPLSFCAGSAAGGGSSASCFSGLGLFRIGTVVSF
jgi:hypothetical protein